jgi:hypothetical protein
MLDFCCGIWLYRGVEKRPSLIGQGFYKSLQTGGAFQQLNM